VANKLVIFCCPGTGYTHATAILASHNHWRHLFKTVYSY